MPESPFSSDVLRVFPSAEDYQWNYLNGRAELLNIWKQFVAQKVLEDHCASMPRKLMNSLGSNCYDMVVRARPELFFSFDVLESLGSKHLGPSFDEVRRFSHVFFSNGINLNTYWNAWDRLELLSTTLPTELQSTILRVDTWVSGPSDGPACVNTAAFPANSASVHDFLPLFSPAYGNDWGGPNDFILWGPFETMKLYFSRAATLEYRLFNRIKFHPETLVKCGMMEALRLYEPNSSWIERPVVFEHIMISLGYCRRNKLNLTSCDAA
jgi:hypothetical protein